MSPNLLHTAPSPKSDESPVRLTTELKHLEVSSNVPADAPDGVAGAKLDIKAARLAREKKQRAEKQLESEGLAISADTAVAPPQPAGKRKESARTCSCSTGGEEDDKYSARFTCKNNVL